MMKPLGLAIGLATMVYADAWAVTPWPFWAAGAMLFLAPLADLFDREAGTP